MLVIDLDHFKAVNNTHGHAVGDIVPEQTGNLLNQSFREGDLVTRYGGEEFVVLLIYYDGKQAVKKADKAREALGNLNPNGLKITTSIGVASIEVGCDQDFEVLFHAGDEGVYRAQENGRNQVVLVGLDQKISDKSEVA